MASDKQGNPLEQFLLLSKSARGAAAVELIKQAVEAPGVYVFAELLSMPNIQELSKDEKLSQYVSLLNLFAYGTYSDYQANTSTFPDLSPIMLKKLRHLTIVSQATKSKCLPYSVLLQQLGIKNVRELEDLIIEVIYADIISGKLDQKNQQLEVDYAIGRDIRAEEVADIVKVLENWCTGCDSVLKGIEEQISRANNYKNEQISIKQKIDNEVINIKKTLKTTQQQDMEEQMVTDSKDVSHGAPEKTSKKSSKTKGLRGSAKLFGKSQ